MRLFTAVCFDEETKSALFSAEEAISEKSSGSFSLRENLHLTLVYIGETDRAEEIKSALSKIEFSRFDFKIRGTGTFEKGILWAGTSEDGKLRELRKTVFKNLSELGFDLDEREFVPHITLAKKYVPAEDFSFGEAEKLLPEKTLNIKRISLMKSERAEGVLRYTEIYSVNLI